MDWSFRALAHESAFDGTRALLGSRLLGQKMGSEGSRKCFCASIAIRLKAIFAHCEKFLTVGESVWHWPLRKKT